MMIDIVGSRGPELFGRLLVNDTHHIHGPPRLAGTVDKELQNLLFPLIAMLYIVLDLAERLFDNIAMAGIDALRLQL